jgi:hypothetical protein
MPSRQRKSGLRVSVADDAGGLREVADHRFEPGEWPISMQVSADEAQAWMAHVQASAETRGWSFSSFGQLHADENSGSMTLQLATGPGRSTIDIAWLKGRRGRLEIRVRPGGDPMAPLHVVRDFVDEVDTRLRTGQAESEHRRGILVYGGGLPWKGELWLTDTLRLGPPSRFPDALLGPQAVIVDAVVSGIGSHGITGNFHRLLQDLCLVLSPIIGIHLKQPRNKNDWVPETDSYHIITGCQIRLIGYAEIGLRPEFPNRGAAPPITRETVRRPGLERFGIWPEDTSERVPDDVEDLWRTYNALSATLRKQYLNACNAYQIAGRMWPDQRTAHAAFLVVACEALKSAGKRYDRANVYDVVSSLVGAQTAQQLESLRMKPQTTRSEHLHRGILVADEFASLLLGDPFADPSFDEMLTVLSQVTRICLIEWLRCRGQYKLTRRSRASVRVARRSHSKAQFARSR